MAGFCRGYLLAASASLTVPSPLVGVETGHFAQDGPHGKNAAGHKPTGAHGLFGVRLRPRLWRSRLRGRYAFRRRKQTIPITAIPANRARLPGSGTVSTVTPH